MVSDLLPVLAVVWTLAKHALVGDDSHGEVVNSDTMVLPAHDLRGHIAWRARSILRIFSMPQAGDSQVSYPQITQLIEDQILWLDVTMQDCVLVQVLKAQEHAGDKEFCEKQNIQPLDKSLTKFVSNLLVCTSVKRRCLPM